MRLRERVVQGEGLTRGGLGPRHVLARRKPADPELAIGVRQARPGGRVLRVLRDRLLEEALGLELPLRRPAGPVEAPLEVGLVDSRVDGRGRGEPALFLRLQLGFHRLRDGACHFALQGQDVSHLALVVPGPEVLVGVSRDELRRHAHAVAGADHRAFHDGVDVELLRDLAQRLVRLLVLRDGGPRDHAQRAHLREIGRHRVRHPVDEVLLLGVAAEVLEGQDRDGPDRRGRPTPMPARACGGRDERDQQDAEGEDGRGARGRPSSRRRRGLDGTGRSRGRIGGSLGLDRGEEPVPAARQRLHEARALRGVAQRVAQPLDRAVEARIEVHEGVGGPQGLAHLVPAHDLARTPEQQEQDLEGLVGKTHGQAVLAQLGRARLELEATEVVGRAGLRRDWHQGHRARAVS